MDVQQISAAGLGDTTTPPPAGTPAVVAPASAAQSRIWMIERIPDGAGAYNVPILIRLRGPIDADLLRAALADVVARHEVLRTTLREDGGELVQVVAAEYAPPLPVTDLSGVDTEARRAVIAAAITAAERRPFDLISGPVLRARLLRLGTREHVLVVAVHHVAMDAWSYRLLHEELAAAYTARVEGAAPLGESPGGYVEYARRERADLTPAHRAELSSFWADYLTALPALDLPTLRNARGDDDAEAGGFRATSLAAGLVEEVSRVAADHGTSMFDVFAAGLAVLLSRYTGQDDIAIGTTVALRDQPELAGLLGPVASTIVVRAQLHDTPDFRTLLARVAAATKAALTHARLPFEDIVTAAGGERSADRQRLFRVYLDVERDSGPLPAFGQAAADAIVPAFTTAKFDLGFGVHLGGAEAVLDIGFDTGIVDGPAAERLLAALKTVLAAAIATPELPVTRLPVLDVVQRHRILVEWNATGRPYPHDRCLHELFERQVDARPDAPAVISGAAGVSYGELERAANAIAHRLRTCGVGPDAIVAVRVRGGTERAPAVLGVLKAGGAFLPIDPDYPAERIAFMLADSAARVLVTDDPDAPETTDYPGRVLHLGAENAVDDAAVESAGASRPVPLAGPDHLAYVVYTSGSTGTPKGIELRHRGAVNNFTDFNDRFAVGPGDTLLAVSSPSFDMSVYDLLGTLAAGATVVYPEPREVRRPGRWWAAARRHAVTIWHSAPALLDLLLDRAEPGGLPALRLALLGGDWIGLDLPGRLRAVAPEVRFIGLGGATEASMDSILYEVGEVDPAWRSIPYGRPMANQRAYILDGNRQPVPIGVPGELYLGGVGLARGYLGRPELTADRFATVELAGVGAERLYHTGDLARYDADGVIELLGRVDLQVKIHGLRIEVGEVESALRAATGVREAVVVARGARGQHTLAAYMQVAAGYDEAAVRAYLTARLPTYMVPSLLVTVEAFPTTPNGKVDRRKLATMPLERPPPGWSMPAGTVPAGTAPAGSTRTGSALAAADPLHQRIIAAWREVPHIDDIGLDDDFFHLGGDPFAAARAMYAPDRTLPRG